MGELHDSLLVSPRKKIMRRRFREGKSPMPSYRPDLYAYKMARSGKIIEEIIIEAEIESTLYAEHTTHQLVFMDQYLRQQKKKRIKINGYLLIPKGKKVRMLAKSLIESLFPGENAIKISQ